MSVKTFVFNSILKMVKKKNESDHENNVPFDILALRRDIEGYNKFMALLVPKRKDVKITEEILGGVSCLHAFSPIPSKRTILYLHGGGYILGLQHQSSAYRYFISELAVVCQNDVWAIDYRLAPENPYPAALEDAYAAYLELLEKGFAANDIFIIGDSAGGGLTLALLMKIRDEGKQLPKAAIPLSPWTDLSGTGESLKTRADIDPMLTPYGLVDMASLVVHKDKIKEPYISPFYGNFEGLPPLMIFVGGREILFDDSLRVAEKAKRAGVDVTLDIQEEMIHVYPVFGGIFKEGKEAIDRMAEFVKKHSG